MAVCFFRTVCQSAPHSCVRARAPARAEIKGTGEKEAAETEAEGERRRGEEIGADVFIARVHCKVRRPSVQINTRVAHVTV